MNQTNNRYLLLACIILFLGMIGCQSETAVISENPTTTPNPIEALPASTAVLEAVPTVAEHRD